MPNSKIATYGGWMIVAIAVLMGIGAVYSSLTYSRFHTRVQQLQEAGEITSLDDLVYEVENELDDARFYLEKIAAMKVDYSVIPRDENDEIKTDAQSIALFEKFAAEHQAIFEHAKLAVESPDFSIKTDDTQMGFDLEVHRLEEAMEWKGRTLIAKRNGQGACEVAIDMLQLAKKTEHPFGGEAIQGLSFRSVAWQILYDITEHDLLSTVAPETLAEVFTLLDEPDLNGPDFLATYCTALKNERSIATYYILNSENPISERYGMDQSKLAKATKNIPAGPAIFVGNALLDQIGAAIADSQTPLSTKLTNAPNEDWNILVAIGGDLPNLQSLSAGFVHLREQFGGGVAMNRVLRILLALHMADDAKDRTTWPAEYLVGLGVPEASTIDPFTDKPLTIKRVNNRWLVYSYGYDRADDGGDWQRDLRFGGKDIFEKQER